MNVRGVPEEHDYDVIVVGAGPAGAMMALSLRRFVPSISVALLDKADFPRDKPCGDGLSPGVVKILSDLDVLDLLDGYKPVSGVTIAGPSGSSVNALLPNRGGSPTTGYVIPRMVFDERLARRAVREGAALLTRHRFLTLVQRDSHVEISVSEEGVGEKTMTARYVVGADGAGSRVRHAVLEPRNDDRHTAIAIRSYASCEYSSHLTQHSLFLKFSDPYLPAYGWAFPVDKETINIGLGIGVDQLKRRDIGLRSLLESFARDLKSHGYHVGELNHQRTHILPLASHLPRLAHGRVALIGDAASMINPTSGEGIFYGMEAGRMLARHISESEFDHVHLATWEERYRGRFSNHFRSSTLARRLLRRRLWAQAMVTAAKRDSSIIDEGISILFDEGAISPSGMFRIVKAATIGSTRPEDGSIH